VESLTTILVLGANGATGQLLVKQLLEQGEMVKVIVRSRDSLSDYISHHKNLSIIHRNITDITDEEMVQHVEGCRAIASCLGHNMTLKGLFGPPHRLVTDSVIKICNAIQENNSASPVKVVLMNTTGNRNGDLNEDISFMQKCIIFLLRLLLPPHRDNENAADFLMTHIAQNNAAIEWAAVRPDSLINETMVSDYEIHPSPIRSAIFDAGKTSRINVGHFMARLITNKAIWNDWKGKMPVIYNKA
jgi:nucleoside-diphosphate-sugar epimerase